MKLYVVTDDYGSCPSDHDAFVIGVFSTEEAAERHARTTEKLNDSCTPGSMESRHLCTVSEHDLDVPESPFA